MDIVPVRLKNAVLRIVSRSKHRAYYLPQKESCGATTPSHVRTHPCSLCLTEAGCCSISSPDVSCHGTLILELTVKASYCH